MRRSYIDRKSPYETPTDEFEQVTPKPSIEFKGLKKVLNKVEETSNENELEELNATIKHIRWKIELAEKGDCDVKFITGQIIMHVRAFLRSLPPKSPHISALRQESEKLVKEIGFETPLY